ncbi:protein FAM49B [Strongylocentrotus purpuratus]|uniref:CYRIA/CYRIB Rac1 binding domain-containing protein n=1 Tax=Strongylocentrotus purpuratus TaxID=7668 RepID=A0A7M7LWP1_STRPU|nr:protein FAM49B [Strongylocentrotus purpuratus]|eukprot:XP_011682814.1 PREDICTED: protein FAM49B [Strongylocentrotus purpuratus]
MGNILKLLGRDEPPDNPRVYIDFEDAQPTDEEREVFDRTADILKELDSILEDVQKYSGAGEEIRQAITSPRDNDLQQLAWGAVCPLVARLKKYYEFSMKLDKVNQELLNALCTGTESPVQQLEQRQALAKQFAQVLHFTLKFDDLKMTNPSIQNDFSYYRRTLSRIKMANQPDPNRVAVNNEMANKISLFYAHATPMLKTIVDSTIKFVSANKEVWCEKTTDVLSTMAQICRVMIDNPDFVARFQERNTVLFCLRVMVALIILYDHVHPVGAFDKSAPINVKSCVKVLKDQEPTEVEHLLNALRYNSKHLNDQDTPNGIRKVLLVS